MYTCFIISGSYVIIYGLVNYPRSCQKASLSISNHTADTDLSIRVKGLINSQSDRRTSPKTPTRVRSMNGSMARYLRHTEEIFQHKITSKIQPCLPTTKISEKGVRNVSSQKSRFKTDIFTKLKMLHTDWTMWNILQSCSLVVCVHCAEPLMDLL